MRLLIPLALSAILVASASSADEPAEMETTQLKTWIEMLDSPKYRDRTEATTKLQRSGGAAIKALEKAVIGGSSEASDRALGVLEHHYLCEDEFLKELSNQALTRIAEQGEPAKAAAARRILDPGQPPSTKRSRPMLRVPNLGIPNPAALNRHVRIRVSVTNGSKDISVEENGKSIRVIENGDGIQVEKKDQTGKTVKTKYKDVAELQAKDVDAHRAYQKAAGGQIQIQLKPNGVPIQDGRLPAERMQHQLPQQIEALRKQIEEHRIRHAEQMKQHQEILERIHQSRPVPPAVPRPRPTEPKIVDPLEV